MNGWVDGWMDGKCGCENDNINECLKVEEAVVVRVKVIEIREKSNSKRIILSIIHSLKLKKKIIQK